MAKLTHTAPQARDFSAAERRALLARGIAIVGAVLVKVQGDDGKLYDGNGYELSDNGCSRIRTYAQVRRIAAGGSVADFGGWSA